MPVAHAGRGQVQQSRECGQRHPLFWGLTVRCSSRPSFWDAKTVIFMPFRRNIRLSTLELLTGRVLGFAPGSAAASLRGPALGAAA